MCAMRSIVQSRAMAGMAGLVLVLGTGGGPAQAQVAPSANAATGNRGDELLRLTGTGYEVYAPSSADIERGREGVEYARAQYREIFGEAPPPLVFVLFETSEQAELFRSRVRDRALQTWPSTSQRPPDRLGWAELGLALREATAGILVSLYDPDAPATGLRDGDILQSVNGRPVQRLRDVAALLDVVPLGEPLLLQVARGGTAHSLEVVRAPRQVGQPVPAAVTARWPPDEAPTDVATIAHEAMHSLVAARYGRAATLPAWLAEGLASYIEPRVGGERGFWTLLRGAASQIVPLTELLSMPHPAAAGVPAGSPRGNTVTLMAPGGNAARMVYMQGMALLVFMAEQEDARFVGRVADHVAAGGSLASALAHSRNLPRDIDAMDVAFREWLALKGIPVPSAARDSAAHLPCCAGGTTTRSER